MFINPILCQISKSGLVTFLELFDKTRVIIYVLITVGEIKCLTLKFVRCFPVLEGCQGSKLSCACFLCFAQGSK